MTEHKEVEQQIASLAARVDPGAFDRGDDQSLQGRRAAMRVAAERVSNMQMLLALGTVALACFGTVGFYILGG